MFSIRETDAPAVSDSASSKTSDSVITPRLLTIRASDAPEISDSASHAGMFSIRETDAPAVSDSASSGTSVVPDSGTSETSGSVKPPRTLAIQASDAPEISHHIDLQKSQSSLSSRQSLPSGSGMPDTPIISDSYDAALGTFVDELFILDSVLIFVMSLPAAFDITVADTPSLSDDAEFEKDSTHHHCLRDHTRPR